MSQFKVVLTSRDFEILNFLFQQKVASLDIVRDYFFKHTSRNSCIKRMQKLLYAGLVIKTGFSRKTKRLLVAYSITDRGLNEIKSSLCLLKEKGTFKSDSIDHDIQLSIIRNKLHKRSSVGKYYSENAIKNLEFGLLEGQIEAYRRLRSDAVLKLSIDSESYLVALEYERERKKKSRYRKKIKDYYLETSTLAALYICRDISVLKLIKEIDKDVSKKFDDTKIYTILERDFIKSENKIPFKNSKDGILHL